MRERDGDVLSQHIVVNYCYIFLSFPSLSPFSPFLPVTPQQAATDLLVRQKHFSVGQPSNQEIHISQYVRERGREKRGREGERGREKGREGERKEWGKEKEEGRMSH